jgi:hypothetical protein
VSELEEARKMSGWSNELESLEKVMRVYDELGGDAEPEIHDLVTVSRRFLRECDLFCKEAPFASSKKEKHHLYLFRDLIVIGRQSSTRKYKVTHYVYLKQCTFRETPKPDADGHFTVTLTHVSRHRLHPDGTLADPHDTSARIVTRIEKLELSFLNEKTRSEFMTDVTAYLDEVEQDENAKREAALKEEEASNGGAEGVKKQRSWAKKRNTLTKSQKNLVHKGDDDDTASVSESVGGLSLSDLEARYSIDFQTPTPTNAPNEKVEYEICFGEGPMGFSLGSGPGVGVLVGRLAPGSFAEMGGVCIGDRIMFLENEEIGLNLTWQECVEKLKKFPRPVTITFERSAARQVDIDDHHHDDHHHEETKTPAAGGASAGAPAASGEHHHHGVPRTASEDLANKKRNWANRRAQRAATAGGAGGMISLQELEKVYNHAEATKTGDVQAMALFDHLVAHNPAEKSCAAVLKEIFVTERDYVADLRCLVGEYIIPLRRALRRGKCKEIENGSTICEHNLIRATCNRQSTEAQPILDPDNMKAIFCNTETLMTVNTELLTVLQNGLAKVMQTTKHPTLKDVASVYAPAFRHIMPFFKMYAVYCHQYNSAIQRLLEVRTTNSELHDFLTQKEQKSEFTSLSSLLIKPVQRICKYPLLFQELLKQLQHGAATSGMQSYVEDLAKAAEAVEQIAQSVNAQVGESESMERIVEAYEELGGAKGAPGLVEAHRRFVRTDDALVHEPATDKEGDCKDRLVYMFNDLLIIAKSTHSSGGTLHKLSHVSIVERPKSLLRVFNRSISGTLTHSNSNKKLPIKREQIAKVEHWLDIATMSLTPLEPKPITDKKWGVAIKHIGRKTEEVSKRSTLTKKNTNASGKIITVVEKFEIWFFSREERDSFFEDLNKQIDKQTSLASGQKKAEIELGTPKTQRSWTRKSRHDSSLSGAHGRTASGSALSEIEGKYKS